MARGPNLEYQLKISTFMIKRQIASWAQIKECLGTNDKTTGRILGYFLRQRLLKKSKRGKYIIANFRNLTLKHSRVLRVLLSTLDPNVSISESDQVFSQEGFHQIPTPYDKPDDMSPEQIYAALYRKGKRKRNSPKVSIKFYWYSARVLLRNEFKQYGFDERIRKLWEESANLPDKGAVRELYLGMWLPDLKNALANYSVRNTDEAIELLSKKRLA
ncbi:MAG: hypothetical protein FJ358_00630 [Thaumarchaeota archaeon]|nr:hypothetical protein [Nitrososphaerota archaeon]